MRSGCHAFGVGEQHVAPMSAESEPPGIVGAIYNLGTGVVEFTT